MRYKIELLNDPTNLTLPSPPDGQVIVDTLAEFNVKATLENTVVSPTVTRFEIGITKGVKLSRVASLTKNIAMRMGAEKVSMQTPIPGKTTVGVEVPNVVRGQVWLRDVLPALDKGPELLVVLGKDLDNKVVTCDIAKTPHMLVAGATGSGKSVCLSTIILSLLYHAEDTKLVLIDPKRVEFSAFQDIPQLLQPVVTDVAEAAQTLDEIVGDMELRYDLLARAGCKNIGSYREGGGKMDYVVVVVDELADLMIQFPEVEEPITRLTQLSRAVGIHLILATQRPSTSVITGVIKSNIPTRIAFAVSSAVDSRVILDRSGAQNLLGSGDMLYLPGNKPEPIRAQGCWVSEDEIKRVCDSLRSEGADEEVEEWLVEAAKEILDREGSIFVGTLMRDFGISGRKAEKVLYEMKKRGWTKDPDIMYHIGRE